MSNKSRDRSKRDAAKLISEAPPPPPSIRGGYIPPKDNAAAYAHWNRFPIVGIREAIFLTIGIEPRASQYPEESKNRARFLEIDDLAQAHISFGSLAFYPRGMGQVSVSQWMDWLQTVDMPAPDEWQPIDSTKNTPEEGSSKWHLYEEAVEACIAMANAGNPPGDLTNDLVTYIRNDPNTYEKCCDVGIDDTLLRYIRETGDPRDDGRYIAALSQTNSAQIQ